MQVVQTMLLVGLGLVRVLWRASGFTNEPVALDRGAQER